MALVSIGSGTQTAILASEHALAQSSGIGVYVLLVDTSEMLSGDTLIIRIKTKVATGANFVIAYEDIFTDAQVAPNKYSIPLPSVVDMSCTISQSTGTPRTYKWNLLRM